jgi:energy-converting hydrogenase Eha subunit A
MTDIILAGLSAGLVAFLALFIISFVTLGVIAGVIHLVTAVYRSLVFGKNSAYEEQTV